jgi:hypothetical protein
VNGRRGRKGTIDESVHVKLGGDGDGEKDQVKTK